MRVMSRAASPGLALTIVVAVLCTAPAVAQPIESFFDIYFELENEPGWIPSENSGWQDGLGVMWFEYPDPPVPPPQGASYWNEWFYDGVFRPENYKTVDISFTVQPFDPDGPTSLAWVVVNWTTPEWNLVAGHEAGPPLPGMMYDYEGDLKPAEFFIERSENLWTYGGELGSVVIPTYTITDYNPEWVSIDVQGQNIWLTDGVVAHDCIPEPFSMVMLSCLGAGMVAARKLRGRK